MLHARSRPFPHRPQADSSCAVTGYRPTQRFRQTAVGNLGRIDQPRPVPHSTEKPAACSRPLRHVRPIHHAQLRDTDRHNDSDNRRRESWPVAPGVLGSRRGALWIVRVRGLVGSRWWTYYYGCVRGSVGSRRWWGYW